jgi:cellulose synthase/poly-beta-1,6-N-acetylglucosamine synthase-like glycosyltransferase
MTRLFVIVLARDRKHVDHKIRELETLGVPYKIVCGERLNHPNVVYRAPKGKYEAINFGASLIPKDVDIVVMNDVDTVIHNFYLALRYLKGEKVALVFGTELVREGPQNLFFRILNPIRRRIPVAASGELMFIRRDVFEKVLPLKPCKAEDTYILFKVLEYGYKIVFCEDCYAETERTRTAEEEEIYKRRTVTGIYQALSYTKPPLFIRLFYFLLPLMSLVLLILGKKGYYWTRGILLGFLDHLRGDRSGSWKSMYME